MKVRIVDVAVGVAFIVMMIAIALQVFFRYVLNNPLAGSEEVGRLAFVWVTFIGTAIAARDNKHVRIDYFVRRFGPVAARICTWIEVAATAAFGLVMVWVGFLLARFSWNFESASLQFPMTLVHASIPVAGLLVIASVIRGALAERQRDGRRS